MWVSGRSGVGGNTKFFRITFRHETLVNHYQTNFALMQYHKYTLSDLDDMLPWERNIYIDLLVKYLEEEKERIKLQRQTNKRR